MAVAWNILIIYGFAEFVVFLLLAKLFFKHSWKSSLSLAFIFSVVNILVQFAATKLLLYSGFANWWTLNTVNPLASFILLYAFIRYVKAFFVESAFWKGLIFFIVYTIFNAAWKFVVAVIALRSAATKIGGVA